VFGLIRCISYQGVRHLEQVPFPLGREGGNVAPSLDLDSRCRVGDSVIPTKIHPEVFTLGEAEASVGSDREKKARCVPREWPREESADTPTTVGSLHHAAGREYPYAAFQEHSTEEYSDPNVSPKIGRYEVS